MSIGMYKKGEKSLHFIFLSAKGAEALPYYFFVAQYPGKRPDTYYFCVIAIQRKQFIYYFISYIVLVMENFYHCTLHNGIL